MLKRSLSLNSKPEFIHFDDGANFLGVKKEFSFACKLDQTRFIPQGSTTLSVSTTLSLLYHLSSNGNSSSYVLRIWGS
jgi:hypothetical protein